MLLQPRPGLGAVGLLPLRVNARLDQRRAELHRVGLVECHALAGKLGLQGAVHLPQIGAFPDRRGIEMGVDDVNQIGRQTGERGGWRQSSIRSSNGSTARNISAPRTACRSTLARADFPALPRSIEA